MNFDWWRKMVNVKMLRAELEFHQHVQAAHSALKEMTSQSLRSGLSEERLDEIREAIGQLQREMNDLHDAPLPH